MTDESSSWTSRRFRIKRPWFTVGVVGVVVILAAKGCHSVPSSLSDLGVHKATGTAATALGKLHVAPDTSMSGYSRTQFGPAWADVDRNHCDTRNDILARDLVSISRWGPCTVTAGILNDPYTGAAIHFRRGIHTSALVQIDHVVPLGNAWATGAQDWSATEREQLANDDLNLLAVDSHNNEQKGDDDAAHWLPPLKSYDCDYVARQIAVKTKYHLTINAPEKSAMTKVLASCSGETVPSK